MRHVAHFFKEQLHSSIYSDDIKQTQTNIIHYLQILKWRLVDESLA